jgi:hypothetical protein
MVMADMNNLMRVEDVKVEEGDLYEVSGMEGPLCCSACGVVARVAGRWYRHSAFVVLGHSWDAEDSCNQPNHNARNEAQAFADRVWARGRVDLQYWEVVKARPGFEENAAQFGPWWVEEECERLGVPVPA